MDQPLFTMDETFSHNEALHRIWPLAVYVDLYAHTWLSALGHLDLQLVSIGQVPGRHTKPARRNLCHKVMNGAHERNAVMTQEKC